MKVFLCFFVSLQVRVLTDLDMFSEATRVLCALLLGEKLPKISDVGFRTVENKTVCIFFFFELLPLALFADIPLVNLSFIKNKIRCLVFLSDLL